MDRAPTRGMSPSNGSNTTLNTPCPSGMLPVVRVAAAETTGDPSRGPAALTLSPMLILLKRKVLRWALDCFTAGSMVSWSIFSTNWHM
ncbi:hypothetical protein EYF80_019061 [Liparis tanakae]|uniref:Uncharacterized protein n=1 Tax=Liparis tanakae TaxID=230148 RepID=A0A4Z2HYP3_9TELE|nr:hypothetical protein EYF80_019061 [Liparis tanakae]